MEYIEITNKFKKTLVMKGLLHSGKNITLKAGENCIYHHTELKPRFEHMAVKLFEIADVKWTNNRRLVRIHPDSVVSSGSIAIFKYEV